MRITSSPFSHIDVLWLAFKRCVEEPALQRPYRFCFYGYTDVMLNKEEWLRLIEPEKYARLTNRENWQNLIKVHNRPDVEVVPTLSSIENVVFDGQISIEVFDFQKYEGTERMVDLNFRVPAELEQRYDMVFDNGTSEHCFNYPQVLMNSHLIAKESGFIRHDVPLNWPNHGFYNLSPTLFHDFYGDNQAKTVECMGHYLNRGANPPQHMIVEDVPQHERFLMSHVEMILVYTVQKLKHQSEFVYPVQYKYRDIKPWV